MVIYPFSRVMILAPGLLFILTGHAHAQNKGDSTVADSVAKTLKEVTVTAKKPLFEQQTDRLVINVSSSSTAAGNTALEILERSPGVVIDRENGGISINGKNGVVVMINGKINYMPINAVVQLLAGMNAGNIEKIELITNPPANFNAGGNAGSINIVLKENNDYGTNGSFSLSGGYSRGEIIGGSININHRKGRVNWYGDGSYSRNKGPFTVNDARRSIYRSDLSENNMKLDRIQTSGQFDARTGMDVQLDKQTVLGVLVSGYDNYYAQHEQVGVTKKLNGTPDTIMMLANNEVNHWRNLGANINVQHTYNKEDKVSINLDYIGYDNRQPVHYLSDYYNGKADFLYEARSRSSKITPLHFWVAALDLSNQLTKQVRVETGGKVTLSTFGNDISFERWMPTGYEKDNILTSDYRLKENYSAAYASLRAGLGKTTEARIGLRYEYTWSNLGSAVTRNILDKHYGNFFPGLSLTHTIDDKNSISFSYSRRINRPSFNDLAPGFYYSTPVTIITGDPYLEPSITNTLQFNYTFSKCFLSLSLSKEKNAIAGFQPDADSVSGIVVLSPVNLGDLKTITTALSIPVAITNWWSMQYNCTALWQQVNAIYQKQPVRLEQINFRISGNMNFTLPRNLSADLSGFFQSKSLSGLTRKLPMGAMDIGLRKKLPGRQGAFTLSVNNIFNTLVSRNRTEIPEKNLYEVFDIRFARQSVKLTYTRSFGKEKLQQKRDRSTGAEDEKSRVQ
jgi:outer membrane receptor protein involved in Fe transport